MASRVAESRRFDPGSGNFLRWVLVALVLLLAFGPLVAVASAEAPAAGPDRLTALETRLDTMIWAGGIFIPTVIGLFVFLVLSTKKDVISEVHKVSAAVEQIAQRAETRADKTDQDLSRLRVHVAETYAERAELGAVDRRIDGLAMAAAGAGGPS